MSDFWKMELLKLKKQMKNMSSNFVRYDLSLVATADGQTEFAIDLDTFDKDKDCVFVQSGRTMLSATLDYAVTSNSVVLNEGVPVGRTIDIYVFKNLPNLDDEVAISGVNIGVGSIPLDRLESQPALASHTHSASNITSGTLSASRLPSIAADKIAAGTFSATGVKAKSDTDYATSRVRNISMGTTDLTAGTSTLASGDIYFVYE